MATVEDDIEEAVPQNDFSKEDESSVKIWDLGQVSSSGVVDVNFERERERRSEWEGRNQRMQRLRALSIQNSRLNLDHNQNHATGNYMGNQLYWAATKDDVDGFMNAIQRLISEEKDLSLAAILDTRVTPLGNTLLHVAARHGNSATVRLIGDHFPSLVTKKNSKGDTALHIAARAGHDLVVATLVELGGVVLLTRIVNDEGNTALHDALINRHESVALPLIWADREVIYYLNNQEKSALYLTVEAGYEDCIRQILEDPPASENIYERLKGKSPIHAAVMGRKKDVLDVILKKEPRFIYLRDEEGRTPLHCATSIGYIEGVNYLLCKHTLGAMERDKNGSFPIHWASIKGHVDVIKVLLQHCLDPRELLNHHDQNILHVAADSGQHNVVRYILKTPNLEILINEKDKDGNTPLHLATMQSHPKIVSALTWDKRVDLKLINNEGFTALDAAEYMERMASFRQPLTWAALKAAKAPRAPSGKVLNTKPPNMDNYKDRVNTLLLVSTLVATVTFAAGFTVPGGYNNSDPDQGLATLLRHKTFHMFVFCDTIAMYSSIIVAVTLIWAQLGDLNLVLTALKVALPLLGIALTMMSLTFMAGLHLVVSKLGWLANAVLIMGVVFLLVLSTLFFPLFNPISSRHRILRYISYYPFSLLIWATGSNTNINLEE